MWNPYMHRHNIHLTLLLTVFALACSANGTAGKDGGSLADSGPQGADALCSSGTPGSDSGAIQGYCYQTCSTTDDCASLVVPGERCQTGYTCGIPYTKGHLACQPLCVCKDLLPSGTPQVPRECLTDGGS
jgi:hypothetical protein